MSIVGNIGGILDPVTVRALVKLDRHLMHMEGIVSSIARDWSVGTEIATVGTATVSRDTSLPSPVPTTPSLFVLNQGAGLADILYLSMKDSTDTWQWVRILAAP